jgi:hypothetical protein
MHKQFGMWRYCNELDEAVLTRHEHHALQADEHLHSNSKHNISRRTCAAARPTQQHSK